MSTDRLSIKKCQGDVFDYSYMEVMPIRDDCLIPSEKEEDETVVENGEDFMFLPGPLHEANMWDPIDKRSKFAVILFGNQESGKRRTVVLEGFLPNFMIRVPKTDVKTLDEFQERVVAALNSIKGCKVTNAKIVRGKRYVGYERNDYPYLKLEFDQTYQRKLAIQWAQQQGYSTGSDDTTSYCHVFSRETEISLTAWMTISNYRVVEEHRNLPENDGPFIFVHYTDVHTYRGKMNRANLLKENSLVAYWDTETYSPTRRVPWPTEPGAFIFQLSIVFRWASKDEPIINYLLTNLPTEPVKGHVIILCETEKQLLIAFSEILQRMRPEFIGTFNGGGYDWPWLRDRCKVWGILDDFIANTSSFLRRGGDNDTKWNFRDMQIKIEAASAPASELTLAVPGIQCFDVQNVFRQFYPTDSSWGLNHFLARCELPPKNDMDAATMFKLVDRVKNILHHPLYSRMLRMYKTEAKDTPVVPIRHMCKQFALYEKPTDDMAQEKFAARLKKKNTAQLDKWDDDEQEKKTQELLEEFKQAQKETAVVADYCVVDSDRCHKLMLKKGVFTTRRNLADISFTSMSAAIYRAGGCKVRNRLIGAALKKGFIASNNTFRGKSDIKYPGARVINPIIRVYTTKLKPLERMQKNIDYLTIAAKHPELYNESTIPERQGIPYPAFARNGRVDEKFQQLIKDQNAALEKYLREHPDIMPVDMKKHNAQAVLDAVAEDNPDLGPLNKGFLQYLMDDTDTPMVIYDYNSLYPNLARAYNMSPERLITPETEGSLPSALKLVDKLKAEGKKIHSIEFPYGEDATPVRAWSVRHNNGGVNDPEMGVLASTYEELFQLRAHYKDIMAAYEFASDYMKKKSMKAISIFELMLIVSLGLGYTKTEEWLQKMELYPSTEELTSILRRISEFKAPAGSLKTVDADPLKVFLRLANRPADATYVDPILEESKLDTMISYADIGFLFERYNKLQELIKVYMNTFYGEAGSQISPLYMKELAGGITTAGRYNLDKLCEILVSYGCTVRYGDTDSAMVTLNHALYADAHKQYFSGQIDKLAYWNALVKIATPESEKLRNLVNAGIKADNGTIYLKVGCEGMLWPYAFQGKKRYAGLKQGSIPKFIIKGIKEIYMKGIDAKKRGTSKLSIRAMESILMTIFHPENKWTMRELVLQEIDNMHTAFVEGTIPLDDFVKSAKYQPKDIEERLAGKGNKSMLLFADIMQRRGTPLEPYTRVSFVIARKYPWEFEFNGKRRVLKTGERMETLEYIQENKISPDIDYYITHYICGQLAPFLAGHSDFAQEPLDESAKAWKAAYTASVKKARAWLVKYYKPHEYVYPDLSKVNKLVASFVMDGFSEAMGDDHDDAFELLKYKWNIGTKAKMQKSIVDRVEKEFLSVTKQRKLADDADTFVSRILRGRKGNEKKNYLFTLHKMYVSGAQNKFHAAKAEYEREKNNIMVLLGTQIATVMGTLHAFRAVLEDLITQAKTIMNFQSVYTRKKISRIQNASDIEELIEALNSSMDEEEVSEMQDDITAKIEKKAHEYIDDKYHVRGIDMLTRVYGELRAARMRYARIEAVHFSVKNRVAEHLNGYVEPTQLELNDLLDELKEAIDKGDTCRNEDGKLTLNVRGKQEVVEADVFRTTTLSTAQQQDEEESEDEDPDGWVSHVVIDNDDTYADEDAAMPVED